MKTRLRIVVVLLTVTLALVCRQSLFAGAAEEQAALEAAKTWLALVDSGEYDTSWDQAASFFKSAVTKDQWGASLRAVRKPLGAVASRQLASTKYTTALPGAPDGNYVVIQFNASFAAKKNAVETVTPMLDKDGKWRVSGYFIK